MNIQWFWRAWVQKVMCPGELLRPRPPTLVWGAPALQTPRRCRLCMRRKPFGLFFIFVALGGYRPPDPPKKEQKQNLSFYRSPLKEASWGWAPAAPRLGDLGSGSPPPDPPPLRLPPLQTSHAPWTFRLNFYLCCLGELPRPRPSTLFWGAPALLTPRRCRLCMRRKPFG